MTFPGRLPRFLTRPATGVLLTVSLLGGVVGCAFDRTPKAIAELTAWASQHPELEGISFDRPTRGWRVPNIIASGQALSWESAEDFLTTVDLLATQNSVAQRYGMEFIQVELRGKVDGVELHFDNPARPQVAMEPFGRLLAPSLKSVTIDIGHVTILPAEATSPEEFRRYTHDTLAPAMMPLVQEFGAGVAKPYDFTGVTLLRYQPASAPAALHSLELAAAAPEEQAISAFLDSLTGLSAALEASTITDAALNGGATGFLTLRPTDAAAPLAEADIAATVAALRPIMPHGNIRVRTPHGTLAASLDGSTASEIPQEQELRDIVAKYA